LPKLFFPEGIGGVQKSRNSGGVREEGGWWCYFSDQNMEIPGSMGGLCKIPSVGGTHIFWKAHILDTLRNRPFVRGLSS